MTFFKNFIYVLCVISFGAYVAFYHILADNQYSGLVDEVTEKPVPPVKIVLWTGSLKNGSAQPWKEVSLDRVQKVVEEINKKKNGICRDIQQDGLDAKRVDWDKDEAGNCEFAMSAENEAVADVDAIAFSMFTHAYNLSELPQLENRDSEQIWVAYAIEPPPSSEWKDPYRNIFNWTMSYRRDADIWTPYGKYVQHNTAEDPKFIGGLKLDQWIRQKSKLIFGVISHCRTDSLREKLIAELNNTGVQVDVFGRCGLPTCGTAKNCTDYWSQYAKDYSFYMAFENSLCEDYITEKFWRALDLGIVPVVYGGGNYELDAPPGSYINAREFPSAEGLMKYLQYLSRNHTEYAKYFEWKYKYKVQKDWDKFVVDWCYLCGAVKRYRREGRQARNMYENLKFWWWHQSHSNKSACISEPKKFFSN